MKIPESYQGDSMVFIVGCQRSGTSWLQELLSTHPEVRSGAESFLFVRYIGRQVREWRNELAATRSGGGGDGMQTYLMEPEFKHILREEMLGLMEPMVGDLKPGEVFVEKTPDHSLFIPEIFEMLPRSRFVHILRDGRDVSSSILAASKTFGAGWAPKNATGAARWWVRRVSAIREASKNLPKDQLIEVKYEDLKTTPIPSLRKVTDFLGLEWSESDMEEAVMRNDAKVTREKGTKIPVGGEYGKISGESELKHSPGFLRKGQVGSWREDLSLVQKFRVWAAAHKTMDEVGYPWKYPW